MRLEVAVWRGKAARPVSGRLGCSKALSNVVPVDDLPDGLTERERKGGGGKRVRVSECE